MRRRWTLLGLVLGLMACFNTPSQSASCDYTPGPLSWGSVDAGTRTACTAAGGSCPYSQSCSPGEHVDYSLVCSAGGFTCCMPDVRDASRDDGADDGAVGGLCNFLACAAGCTCEPAMGDAGGGVCMCPEPGLDAGADVGGDSETDAATTDGPGDASQDAPAPSEAGDAAGLDSGGDDASDAGTSAACGVIQCASPCECLDPQLGECVCL